ncbi:DUF302 domain-containing protein [Pararhodonellum marinum]|uniref:DUF302 domain-containing protein n=1 Tax=Pararhodonellum marinum TaxID=2755358 RepID=UPI00188ECC8D|nr:DUF302 domain-containing protein [Pararhodonellum marinum]
MKLLQSILFLLLTTSFSMLATAQDLIVKQSNNDHETTLKKLKFGINDMGLNLVQHIDHAEAAGKANMDLNPTDVLIFGNPEVGTKLMKENPQVAIELPLKILVYKEGSITFIGYENPNRLIQTYQLDNQREVLSKMKEALEKITDEAIH